MAHILHRLSAVALVAAFLVSTLTAPAGAHGDLLYSDPDGGGMVEALPSRAILTFSDAVREIREITVVGPEGSVTNGAPTSIGPEVRQNLWAGVPGAYTMEYFVVSADGHDVRGEVQFEVGQVSGATGTATAAGGGADEEDPSPERGRGVILPGGLVLLAAAVALLVLRLRRTATPRGHGRGPSRSSPSRTR